MKSLLRVIAYIRPYRRLAVATLAAAVAATFLDLVPPWLIKSVIDRAIPTKDLGLLALLISTLVAAHFGRNVLQGSRIRFNNRLEQKVIHDMRTHVYRSLQRLSIDYFEARSTGELMSRINNDVNNIERVFIDGVEHFVIAVMTLAGILVMLFILNWKLCLAAMVPIPFLVLGSVSFTGRVHSLYHDLRRALARMNALLQDNISGIRETKSFNREGYEAGRFEGKSKEYSSVSLKVARLWSLYSPGMLFLGSVGTAFVLYLGARDVIEGTMTLGSLVAFLSYIALFYGPINQIHSINHKMQHALAASDRVFEVVDAEPNVREADRPVIPEQKIQGLVRFQNVAFHYLENYPVLEDITFEILPGERVALAGSTGAGKTTIISLLLRFYDCTGGHITLDGYDIKELPLSFLRNQIALVSQEPFLFNGTVRENIAYGDLEATDDEIAEVARAAHAHDFIKRLPKGYDSWIGERGVKLSVGEKQRLAIARALLKNPPVIILDEATSSLDTETEAQIQAAIGNLIRSRTTLMIAHRLTSLRTADKILVIRDGRVAEEGNHDTLLARDGAYTRLFEAQVRIQ